VENTCSMSFMISYITKELSFSALVLIPLSKMGWLNEKIGISWTLFTPYCLSPLFVLNSGLRHYLLQFT
jgi:predicted 3-demethylubiquinone-9 3-methyltransferase (glyoxalase superfamily)